jgi:PKD repeat protein
MKSATTAICLLLLTIVVGFGSIKPAAAVPVDNGDGTVTDSRGLMWLQAPAFYDVPPAENPGMTFDEANAWAALLVFAGYDDWRLPSALDFDTGLPDTAWRSTNNEWGYLYGVEWGNPWGKAGGASLPPGMETMPEYWDYTIGWWTSTVQDVDNAYYFHATWDQINWQIMGADKSEHMRGITAVRETTPIVIDVVPTDPSGSFAVSIDAGIDKGSPVLSWTVIGTTNIASYTVTQWSDIVLIIEGQLLDPSIEGQILLEVDPPDTIITYQIDIAPAPAVYAPVASFTETAESVPAGVPITFDPSGSYDSDGSIVLYEWDWDGDGTYDESSPTPDPVSHTYSTDGSYTVTLRVTDNDGLTNTATATKTIEPCPENVIPEVPLGTILASVAMIGALVSYFGYPKLRRKHTSINP